MEKVTHMLVKHYPKWHCPTIRVKFGPWDVLPNKYDRTKMPKLLFIRTPCYYLQSMDLENSEQ